MEFELQEEGHTQYMRRKYTQQELDDISSVKAQNFDAPTMTPPGASECHVCHKRFFGSKTQRRKQKKKHMKNSCPLLIDMEKRLDECYGKAKDKSDVRPGPSPSN